MARLTAILFWLVLGLLSGSALLGKPSQENSLADLARQERLRRQTLPEGCRLITNADLLKMSRAHIITSSVVPVTPVESREALGGESPAESAEPAADAPEQPDWESLFGEARSQLQMAVNSVLVLELKVNNLRNSFLNEVDGAARSNYEAQLNQALEDLKTAREQEAAAREALEKLIGEANTAGLEPGTLRRLSTPVATAPGVTP